MNKNSKSVKFNLTPSMSFELIKYNNLKKELNKLKEQYDIDKNEQILLQIEKKQKELNNTKDIFIREFRCNNQDEITEYLYIKDQKN